MTPTGVVVIRFRRLALQCSPLRKINANLGYFNAFQQTIFFKRTRIFEFLSGHQII